MADLIDRQELWKQMVELHEKRAEEANMTGDRVVCVSWHDAVVLLKNAPTIDAEPVRHGQWIREPNCWYRCSECGSHYPSIADNMNYHYCPDCGAMMTLD